MPPTVLAYRPVYTCSLHLGCGMWMTANEERLAAGAEGLVPPRNGGGNESPLHLLETTIHAPRRRLLHTARL